MNSKYQRSFLLQEPDAISTHLDKFASVYWLLMPFRDLDLHHSVYYFLESKHQTLPTTSYKPIRSRMKLHRFKNHNIQGPKPRSYQCERSSSVDPSAGHVWKTARGAFAKKAERCDMPHLMMLMMKPPSPSLLQSTSVTMSETPTETIVCLSICLYVCLCVCLCVCVHLVLWVCGSDGRERLVMLLRKQSARYENTWVSNHTLCEDLDSFLWRNMRFLWYWMMPFFRLVFTLGGNLTQKMGLKQSSLQSIHGQGFFLVVWIFDTGHWDQLL